MTSTKKEKRNASSKIPGNNSSMPAELIKNLFKEYLGNNVTAESTERLQYLFSSFLDSSDEELVFFSYPDLKIIFISPAMAKTFGITAKKQISIYLDKYLRDKSKTAMVNSLKRLKPDDAPLTLDLAIPTKDKESRLIKFCFRKILSGDKTFILANINMRDRYESTIQELRRSEERYRTLVENIHGVFFSVDKNGIVLYVSPAIEKLSGFSPKDLIGKSFQGVIHPDDLPGLFENFKSTLSGKLGAYEYRVKKKKGGYFWIRSYSQVIGSPDDPQGLSGVFIDITERKIFEEELQESRKNFQTFFDTVNEFLFVLDENVKILHTNKIVNEKLGYSEKEIRGKSIINLHPKDNQKEAKAVVTEIFAGRKNTCTLPLVTKTGERIPVETYITHGEWGGRKVLFAVSRDIGRRMKAEEALREKTEELDRFFSTALDLLCIADTKGYFRRLNAEWETTLGWSIEELEGRKFMDFVHPEDKKETLKTIEQLNQQKEVINFTNRYRCKDGAYKWIEWRSFPYGEMIYASARDITDKKRTLEALEESERKYRALIDNSLAGIYITQNHIVKYCNKYFATMFGYENTSELTGKSVKELVDPESWNTVDTMVKMRESGEIESVQYDFKAIKKDGSLFFVEVLGGKINYEGKPAIQGMMVDITDRKRWESSLFAQLERIRNQQASIVEIATNPSVTGGDMESALHATTEITSEALYVDRVSIWIFNETETEIRCIELFERTTGKHSSGGVLSVADHPNYFTAIKTGRGLTINDGVNDSRTKSFAKNYLRPNRIASLLDSPIRHEGKIVGIICCEHIGEIREWNTDELIFAGEVADQITQIFVNSERRKAVESLHESEERFSTFMDHLPAVVFLKDDEGKTLYINKSFEEQFGSDWTDKTVFDKLPIEIASAMDSDDKFALRHGMISRTETLDTLKGKNHIYQTIKFPIHRSGKSPLLGGLAIDITDRIKAEDALKLNSERLQSLLKINQMVEVPAKEIAEFALDEGVRLTKSKYGFLAYLNEDETKINMFSWSKNVFKECKLSFDSLAISVSKTGILSQVINQRKPVLTNDYSAPNPWKSGYPEGHIDLRRIIAIPVFSTSKIVVIAGIANKEEEYNDEDITQLTLLMEGMWNLVERRHNAEILKNREATLNSIFRAAPVGIGMTINRVFQEVNNTLCLITGYSKEELIGQSAAMIYSSNEDFNLVGKEQYRQMAEIGTAMIETKWKRKNGTIINILLKTTPLDAADLDIGVTFTALDITKRKKAEENLRVSESRLRQIIDLVPHFIFAKDSEGRFILVNKAVADAYGTTVKELTGKKDADFAKSEEEVQHFRKDDMEVMQSGAQKIVPEEQITYSTGEKRILQTTKIPFVISESISPGILGISVDITDRKIYEYEREKLIKELEAKNADLESFNYTVSHDLKSPLITIKGFIGMLEYDLASNNKDKLNADIQRIKDAANKMANLLDDLLALSKIGQVASPRVEIPFRMLIVEALALLAGIIEKNKIEIVVQPDLPNVYGVHRRLVEVLQNLIENAIKFMGSQQKPRIEIGMYLDEKTKEKIFFVKDNGIGIDKRYNETIFGLFNQLNAKSEGTGIGLALVKRIIDAHGGKIWVESEGLKKGSIFCFTIPETVQSS